MKIDQNIQFNSDNKLIHFLNIENLYQTMVNTQNFVEMLQKTKKYFKHLE